MRGRSPRAVRDRAAVNTTYFRVPVIDAAQNTNRQYSIDDVAVKVHYTP
jgi:hypothetical protein